jgi:DNA-binding GntR family transcriptional regulator
MAEPSLSEKAYDLIKNGIVTCELLPGDLLAQPQLAEKLQIGMTPIREAMQRLVQEGLVQPLPRLGYIVSPITLSDVQEIFELRSILETDAARLAATRGTDEQLKQLARNANFTYVYHDRESYSQFLAENAQFHRSIAVITGNQRLVESVSKILDELTRVFHLGLDLRDSTQEMREEHLILVEVLLQRDEHKAEQIVEKQISRSQHRVMEALISRVKSSPPGNLWENVQVRPPEPRDSFDS